MHESQKLSFPEFLADLRGVIVSPRGRFQIVQERRALWGSLLLLLFPAYLNVAWSPGIGVDGYPGAVYSFFLPLVLAAILTVFKLFPIHFFGRIFQRRSERGPQGTFRQLLAVYGYTTIPNVLALVFAFALMLLLSETIGSLFRDYKVAAISVAVALGLALFIWHFILVVLALRTVYSLRDALIVLAFIAGSVVGGGGAWLLFMPFIDDVKVDSECLEPILQDRVLRFHSVEPGVTTGEAIQMPVDRLRYRFRAPARFELVVFKATAEDGAAPSQDKDGRSAKNAPKKSKHSPWLVGRILGLPGEQVSVTPGRLTVDGKTWEETYLAPGYRTTGAFTGRKLEPGEYLVLPDNRNIMGGRTEEWYVSRSRIHGRLIVVKWPLGFLLHRPGLFESPGHPADR
jgi:signal peptidase I